MTKYYKNRYRIHTTRASWWDYSGNGSYFVTICTSKWERYFGEVSSGKMHLSDIGKCASQCWIKIPDHFPFVKLDVYVVMPNHIHGIIVIDKPKSTNESFNPIVSPVVETQNFASLQSSDLELDIQPQTGSINKFGPQSKNLASIIRGFKIGVTLFCKQNKILFGWQPRYHDHIIRNKGELNRIRRYIINNPVNWTDDEHYLL